MSCHPNPSVGMQITAETTSLSCPNPQCMDAQWTPDESSKEVMYIGVEFRFTVDVPLRVCACCGEKRAIKPLDVWCLPGTSTTAWTVESCPDIQRPTWVDVGVAQMVDAMRLNVRRASIQKLAEVFDQQHLANDPSTVAWSASELDKFRKLLGRVRCTAT
jgi:hypothetical protein